VLFRSGMGIVQLHGEESAAYIKKISDLRIIKAFRVDDRFDARQLAGFPANAFLLDAFADGELGGTGKTFNWNVAAAALKYGHIILAGGLTPENVGQAILSVRPYAVDICSGIEVKPGKKDPQKMAALFKAIGKTRVELEKGALR
jgi:phosphoribosylanthranilate isomerase